MTFEEYVQKHLGVSGMSYEDMELVGLGWAAHRDHGSCSEIPNSSGHAKEAKGRIEGDKSGYGRIADPALEGKPFTWVFTDVNGKAKEIAGDPVHRSPQDLRIYTALYTHPVSADVPEKWRTVMKELADDLESEIEARRSGDLDRRIERDLIVVKEARVLLNEQEQGL